jgi:hypothetical protein
MKQQNLNTLKSNLTESDIDSIVDIIGHRCRIKTCNRLRSILTYSASSIQSFGILDRLIKENGHWSYCAGQSYPDEIRTVRECILGKRY